MSDRAPNYYTHTQEDINFFYRSPGSWVSHQSLERQARRNEGSPVFGDCYDSPYRHIYECGEKGHPHEGVVCPE